MYTKRFNESGERLIPNESKNDFANKMFKKYLSDVEVDDIVWLQDKSSDYQGYYLVIGKGNNKRFKSLGSILSNSIFKKYGVEEDDVPVLNI